MTWSSYIDAASGPLTLEHLENAIEAIKAEPYGRVPIEVISREQYEFRLWCANNPRAATLAVDIEFFGQQAAHVFSWMCHTEEGKREGRKVWRHREGWVDAESGKAVLYGCQT